MKKLHINPPIAYQLEINGKGKMKNLRQNLEVRATIPVKLGKKSTWEVLFPRRLWLPMWTFDQRKEGKLKLKVE
ncbi:hypothetical protein JHK85_004768 [Glycine max]|nr:hypothetical protein JHK85_004768 [Glycine max]